MYFISVSASMKFTGSHFINVYRFRVGVCVRVSRLGLVIVLGLELLNRTSYTSCHMSLCCMRVCVLRESRII